MSSKIEEGVKFFNDKAFDKAVTAFTAHINNNPQDVKALYQRAMAYRALEKHEASLTDLEKALEIAPQEPDLFSERAVTKFHLKNIAGALNDMNEAALLDPKNGYRYSSRAYIKGHMGDTAGAIADYELAVEIDPEDAISYNNLGLLQEELGKKGASKNNFKKADDLAKRIYGDEYPESYAEQLKDEAVEQQEAPKKEDTPEQQPEVEHISKTTFYLRTIKNVFVNKDEFKAFRKFVFGGMRKKGEDS